MGNNGSCRPQKIITVSGCKGGVGKSVISCALALAARGFGKSVVLVDADFGGPNLHTYLGVQAPTRVLSEFLLRQVSSIEDTIVETGFPGIRLISSAGNCPGQANPKYAQKLKIIKSLQSLDVELVIIDIGAGSSYDVMDFFLMTDDGIVVTSPEPTSIINSYGFVKNVLYRKLNILYRQNTLAMEIIKRGMNPGANDGITNLEELMNELFLLNSERYAQASAMLSRFRPNIVVNMCRSEKDTLVGQKIKAIIKKHLMVDARVLGSVVDDSAVRAAARRMKPFTVLAPDCMAAGCVNSIAETLFQDGAMQSEFVMEVEEVMHRLNA